MRLFIAIVIAISAGCASIVPDSYFEYQKEFDETIIKEYEGYVDRDETLLQLQKENRKASVEIWRENYRVRLANGN